MSGDINVNADDLNNSNRYFYSSNRLQNWLVIRYLLFCTINIMHFYFIQTRSTGKMNAITGVTVNGGDNSTSTVARRPGQTGADSGVNRGSASLAEDIVLDAEKSVMESFEFLNDGSG